MRILIAGGGASGMTAAIAAARRGARVTILEKKEMPGKKILSTGNGRCNLTNMDMEAVYFRGGDRGTIEQVLAAFGPEDTLRFFAELGLMTKARGTLVYPVCDQAAAVREALAMELKRLGVEVRTGVTVERAEAGAEGFRLGLVGADGTRASCAGDALILATGGKAAPALGSDGSGYALAKKLGHTLVRPLPALVQLRSDAGFTGKLSGVRVEARVSLYVEGEEAASDTGEVQFTDYGLSGIPVFQVSRFAARALDRKKQVYARLDFLPDMSREEVRRFLEERWPVFADNTAEEFLHGLFHRKLAPVLLSGSRIRWKEKMRDVDGDALSRLAGVCKSLRMDITDTNSFDQAQVCAGGVPLEEVCGETMESRLTPGLFLAGELLDVDGMCGGYNLQWAWTTGWLAGNSAAEAAEKREDKRRDGRRP